jgi:hypothetical protein
VRKQENKEARWGSKKETFRRCTIESEDERMAVRTTPERYKTRAKGEMQEACPKT